MDEASLVLVSSVASVFADRPTRVKQSTVSSSLAASDDEKH